MAVVRIIIKILLLPVRICLTIIQLVVMFITWLSATVFHILSGIICITAVLGYGFGQETGTEAFRMLAMGFILYVLPILADAFEKYLLNNTKFERGSTGKHGFATLYMENGKRYINLNLQIRFI